MKALGELQLYIHLPFNQQVSDASSGLGGQSPPQESSSPDNVPSSQPQLGRGIGARAGEVRHFLSHILPLFQTHRDAPSPGSLGK